MKRIMTMALSMAALLLCLCGCQLYTYNYQDSVLEYAMITDSDDLSKLEEYPNLEYVDLRGSTCYDAILTYAKAHPAVTVRYNVTMGEKRFDSAETDITLNGYETDFETLQQNLKYLPNVKNVHINQITFNSSQVDNLIAAYPDVTFTYSVELCGRKYESSVTELDLAHLTSRDVDSAINAISILPNLQQVSLSSYVNHNDLSVADVVAMTEACPDVTFNYEFSLFGQIVSTLDEELLFDTVDIGNDGVTQIRDALAIMKNCHSVKLDSCGIDNEVMAQLRSDYPDKNVAWRVFAGKFSMMTDEEMIRMQYSLTNQQAEVLKYCTKVKYMDLQGSKITNIAFAEYMPELECVVLTHTKVDDISPLSNCHDLVWLEVSNCPINDLSSISNLRSLKYLNISNTTVSDLASLNEVPIERFNCVKSYVSKEALQLFTEKHENCYTVSTGNTLGHGWRYEDARLTQPFPYYAHMEVVFRYNDRGYTGNRKEN